MINNKVKYWLKSKVKNKYIHNIDDDNMLPLYYNGTFNISVFNKYYKDEEGDTRPFSGLPQGNSSNINKKYEEIYINPHENKKKTIYFSPNSNHYHTNFLFKQMIDTCENNNLYYYVPVISDDYVHYNKHILVDTLFKQKFYNFCYLYSI